MNLAWFKYYGNLNDFLPSGKSPDKIAYPFYGTPSVKDSIEAMGIPHVEVDKILINGVSGDFSQKIILTRDKGHGHDVIASIGKDHILTE